MVGFEILRNFRFYWPLFWPFIYWIYVYIIGLYRKILSSANALHKENIFLMCGFGYFGGWYAVWFWVFWWLVRCVVLGILVVGTLCGFGYFGGWYAVWFWVFWRLVHCVVAVSRKFGLCIPKVPKNFITVPYNEVPPNYFFQHIYMYGIHIYIDVCQINNEKFTQNFFMFTANK